MLSAAAREARRAAQEAITSLAAQRKQTFGVMLDAEFGSRLADILRSTPQSEQHAAIMRLRAEQAAKSTAMNREEDDAASSARRAALGVLAKRRATMVTGLVRRHRAERVHLALRGRTSEGSRIWTPRALPAVRRLAAALAKPPVYPSPR